MNQTPNKFNWGREAVRAQEIVFSICMGAVALLSRGNPLVQYPEVLWPFAFLLAFNLAYQTLLRRQGALWWVPLVSMAVNCVLVTGVLRMSGGRESYFWPMFLLPIFTACLYLETWHVVLAVLASSGFLAYYYIEPLWYDPSWPAVEFVAKVGIMALAAFVTAHFAAQERTVREALEKNRSELDRMALSLLERDRDAGDKTETMGRVMEEILHDINNRLTVIQGSADLLLEEVAPGTALRRDVERISTAADGMVQLAGNLRNWSQMDQGPLLAGADLSSMMEHIVALLDYKIKRRKLQVESSLPQGLPALPVSGPQLQQTFLALLLHATERSTMGGKLTVAAAKSDGAVEIRFLYSSDLPGDPLDGLDGPMEFLVLHGGVLQSVPRKDGVEILVRLPTKA